MNPLLIGGIILCGLLAASTAIATKWGYSQAEQRAKVQGQYDAFKTGVEEIGKKAEAARIKKEAGYEASIKTAVSERDAALKRLRNNAGKGSRERRLPDATASASSSGQSCIGTATYLAAMAAFRKELGSSMAAVDGYALAGDEAAIDAETLIKAWPK